MMNTANMTDETDRANTTAELTLAQIATLLNMIAADIHVQTMLLHVLVKQRGLNTDDLDDMIDYRNDIVERMQTALMAIQDDLDALDHVHADSDTKTGGV